MCKSANNGCLLRYHVKYLGEAELMKDTRPQRTGLMVEDELLWGMEWSVVWCVRGGWGKDLIILIEINFTYEISKLQSLRKV